MTLYNNISWISATQACGFLLSDFPHLPPHLNYQGIMCIWQDKFSLNQLIDIDKREHETDPKLSPGVQKRLLLINKAEFLVNEKTESDYVKWAYSYKCRLWFYCIFYWKWRRCIFYMGIYNIWTRVWLQWFYYVFREIFRAIGVNSSWNGTESFNLMISM